MPEVPVQTNIPQAAPTLSSSFNWKNVLLALLFGTTIIAAGLAGYYYFQLKPLSPPPPVSPPKTATPSAQKVETASWKTYTNVKYNYLVKYPADYKLGSCSNCSDLSSVEFITFGPPQPEGNGTIMISKVKDKDQTQTVNQYLEDISVALVLNPIVPGSKKRFKLNGIEALTTITKSSIGNEMKNVFLVEGKQGFHISFSGDASLSNKGVTLKDLKNLNVFESMISTFRFD